jgi:hypothetical protein
MTQPQPHQAAAADDEGRVVPSWLVLMNDGGGILVDSSCHHLYRQERIEIDGSISPCCWFLSLPVHCGFCPYQTGAQKIVFQFDMCY